MTKTSEPTILLPNVAEHVDSACIMHELRNLGCISHVIITKCLSMAGALYNRASVHFKYWYENSGTVWHRRFLKEGKTISITTNSYDWRAEALIEDSRPYRERRIDAALCDQDVAQGFNDRRLKPRKDDVRPYKERRLDAVLCDEDVAQGFKDRRIKRVDYMSLPISRIAAALGEVDEVEEEKEEEKEEPVIEVKPALKPLIRNPEMEIRMRHAFRCEITDEIYRGNIQMVRDEMDFAREICEAEMEETNSNVYYGSNYPVIKRKMRTIVV